MAEIKAFKGLRYTEKAGQPAELCCPPYDIINMEQRNGFLSRNPYNLIRFELPKPVEDKSDDLAPYEEAGKTVGEWIDDGILARDDEPSIYIYEMEFSVFGKNHCVKGIIPLVKLEDFSKGIILPHEETLSKAKTDRLNLMKATGCNFSQIYSLYMDEDGSAFSEIDKYSQGKPTTELTDGDGVTHRLWAVSDKAFADKLEAIFADKKLYIADGHHRYETALNYREWRRTIRMAQGTSEYVPMMLVNMENSGLVVFPTHRLVRDLNCFNCGAVVEKSREYFDIKENLNSEQSAELLRQAYENGKKAFALYYNKSYAVMELKDTAIMEKLLPNAGKALRELDVSVLHSLVLERIFGIDKENMANQKNLTYTKSAVEAAEEVDCGNACCAFILNPTKVEEIRDVAQNGEKMPQKSTYFYPKLITGLVMNQIN